MSVKLLLVGSVPPPYHGQAVVTEMVFGIEADNIEKECLNLRFSEDLESVGGLQLSKVKTLIYGWYCILGYRLLNLRSKPVLYYCAGSANWTPLVRDVILLGTVGKLFSKRVIHYHSGGLPEWFAENRLACFLGRWAYGGAWKSLALAEAVEVPCFGDTQKVIVPNGLDVVFSDNERDEDTELLYVGALRETKGVGVILEALAYLKEKKTTGWCMNFVGEWAIPDEKKRWLQFITDQSLGEYVKFSGRLTGNDKWAAYAKASLFLFPSHYESENQPLVVIEAMGMGLPVVATSWRGIPELLEAGKTGYLIDVKDNIALADQVEELLKAPGIMKNMSTLAAERYNEHYTEEAFKQRMVSCLTD